MVVAGDLHIKTSFTGAEEMAQLLRALTALLENLSSVPSSHMIAQSSDVVSSSFVTGRTLHHNNIHNSNHNP